VELDCWRWVCRCCCFGLLGRLHFLLTRQVADFDLSGIDRLPYWSKRKQEESLSYITLEENIYINSNTLKRYSQHFIYILSYSITSLTSLLIHLPNGNLLCFFNALVWWLNSFIGDLIFVCKYMQLNSWNIPVSIYAN